MTTYFHCNATNYKVDFTKQMMYKLLSTNPHILGTKTPFAYAM